MYIDLNQEDFLFAQESMSWLTAILQRNFTK